MLNGLKMCQNIDICIGKNSKQKNIKIFQKKLQKLVPRIFKINSFGGKNYFLKKILWPENLQLSLICV